MDQINNMKTPRNFLILMTFLAFGFLFAGCSIGRPEKIENPTTGQTSETTQSDQISQTPVPTPQEKRVFEQVNRKMLLTVEEGKDNVIVLGNDQTFEIQGVLDSNSVFDYPFEYYSADNSTDSSKVALLVDKSEEGTGRLVLCDGTQVKEIAADVSAFRISNDGSTVAFQTGVYSEGVGCDLYIYDCTSGEMQLIAKSAGWQFVLSPKGKAIAYTVFDDPENMNSWSSVLWTESSNQVKFTRDMIPAALTDDGSIVYAIHISDASGTNSGNMDELWAFTGKKQLLLGALHENSSYTMEIIFNNDFTQVLFDGLNGIYFSKNGETAVLVESNKHIGLVSPACKSIRLQDFADESYSFYLDFTCTKNLYNTLMIISSLDDVSNNIWYFTEDIQSVSLTSISRYESFEQIDNSILTYNDQTDELIFVEDIYSEKYLSGYDSSTEFRIDCPGMRQFFLAKDKTIYYCNSEVERIGDVYPLTLHRISFENQGNDEILSTNCAWMTKYERDNEPDIIYFFEYDETESSTGGNGYIYNHYHDLYMVEDIDGAVPVKIADNVSEVYAGDYGVYYLELDYISPNLVRYFAGDPEFSGEGNKIFDVDLYDENKIFYSSDGTTFEYIANVGKRYMYGG